MYIMGCFNLPVLLIKRTKFFEENDSFEYFCWFKIKMWFNSLF
ncbi:hypothetical protein M153_19900011665 [Pseudoloma neurophilia]|uniref:Uncharacterized protein n=1 Tax=Pseudoloma neurophilia TaxID=146866 RepID=A0A0R0M4U4_9MICR|nr:hypothetical protein M153_19900011665 [Pseudoloma neurophilia]